MMPDTTPSILKGALAGLAAGLVASLAMDGVQRLFQGPDDDDGKEPATQQAADRVSELATGAPVAKADKATAGQLVHYVTGAGLGIAYGIAAEYLPAVTKGAGTAFSSGVAGLLDEGAVPLLGLGPAPWDADAGAHASSLGGHLVFGVVAEATRRAARAMLDRAMG